MCTLQVSPCGACRQVISEFSDDETIVFVQPGSKVEIFYDESNETGIRSIEEWKVQGENETNETTNEQTGKQTEEATKNNNQ